MFKLVIGNDVIYKVDALMYVVLSKVEKHVPYEELVPQNILHYRRGVT
jgi:hypothetical protein